MQKKNQNKTSIIKQIILYTILLILVLLILFSEDIIKLANKNKTNSAENSANTLISNEPNIPKTSAGMIPIKANGENFVITTKEDKDWYDYSKGKPAYVMLNDGYYQSELIRDMTNKELAENSVGNDALVVPNVPNNNPSIFMWIPRFAYKETGEIGYIKEETTPGEDWIIPDIFMYKIPDETKPDFSLTGIWLQKDVDVDFASKITEMKKEEGIYGFIRNTVAVSSNQATQNIIQNYYNTLIANPVGATSVRNTQENLPNVALTQEEYPNNIETDLSNPNRIILQIINTKKHEPIKANITQNTTEGRLEIRVTYTSNGIREILDEYGNQMNLTQTNGITYTDTSNITLARGTYKFTVIDNKGNKKELSITPNIDAIYKVAYVSGLDNMDNTTTYNKTQETKTTAENTLLNQLTATDNTKTYSRAITDSNKSITAITQTSRTSEDEPMYFYGKYKANTKTTYNITESNNYTTVKLKGRNVATYSYYKLDANGEITLSDGYSSGVSSYGHYSFSYTPPTSKPYTEKKNTKTFYNFEYESKVDYEYNIYKRYTLTRNEIITYSRGDFLSNKLAQNGTYTIGSSTKVHSDGYWYVRNSLAPKYTLYKYDSNLALQSTYDVDSKVLTTSPIDISNKGNNKLKLTLNTSGTDYKTYISNDNTNWQEVTDITSNTPKHLNVDGWNNLYIKIETNTSRINNIDVAYYKN